MARNQSFPGFVFFPRTRARAMRSRNCKSMAIRATRNRGSSGDSARNASGNALLRGGRISISIFSPVAPCPQRTRLASTSTFFEPALVSADARSDSIVGRSMVRSISARNRGASISICDVDRSLTGRNRAQRNHVRWIPLYTIDRAWPFNKRDRVGRAEIFLQPERGNFARGLQPVQVEMHDAKLSVVHVHDRERRACHGAGDAKRLAQSLRERRFSRAKF